MKKFLLIMFGFAGLALGGMSLAQVTDGSPTDATPAQFEQWVQASRTQVELKKSKPDFSVAVVQRLQAGKFVTDETILTTATALSYYEQVQAAAKAKGEAEYTFDQTLGFIGQVEPFVYGRSLLEAQLLMKKAFCFTTSRNRKKAIDAYRQTALLLEKLHLQVDQQRIMNLNELAETLFAEGQKAEADKLFLEVMSYPWYNVTGNPEALQNLRSHYYRAARGLINCRRDNLNALKEISLVPATQEELKPILEKAIADAKQ